MELEELELVVQLKRGMGRSRGGKAASGPRRKRRQDPPSSFWKHVTTEALSTLCPALCWELPSSREDGLRRPDQIGRLSPYSSCQSPSSPALSLLLWAQQLDRGFLLVTIQLHAADVNASPEEARLQQERNADAHGSLHSCNTSVLNPFVTPTLWGYRRGAIPHHLLGGHTEPRECGEGRGM